MTAVSVTSAVSSIVSAPEPAEQPPVALSLFAAVTASTSVQVVLSTTMVAANADEENRTRSTTRVK